MAVPSQFRLSDPILHLVDSLAASSGTRSDAIRECVVYWHAATNAAGIENSEALSEEDWECLAHLNDPDPLAGIVEQRDTYSLDWSMRLAQELVGQWDGRSVVLPEHRAMRDRCRKLAARISMWGPIRGYALMAALRYFWRHADAGIVAAQSPEIWMTPTAKGGA